MKVHYANSSYLRNTQKLGFRLSSWASVPISIYMTSSPELEEIQMVFPEVLSGFCGKSKSQAGNIFQTKTRIHLVLNELDACKYATLKSHCEAYVADNPILQRLPLDIECYNEDVASLFLKKINQMRKNPALVYLDQNGVKFLADKYLLELEKMKTTDFMYYFISSSYFLRFGDTEQFQSNITIDIERARRDPYNQIHRNILVQLRERIPKGSNFRLYPFTFLEKYKCLRNYIWCFSPTSHW